MRVFVTSDTHFNHKNIIEYCNRPFTNLDNMNSALIKNWNNMITDDDLVLFLGDFCFCRTADRISDTTRWANALHGQKMIIKGNHDYKNIRYVECGFIKECYQEWNFGRFLFKHRPDNLEQDVQNYDFVFFGHIHNKNILHQPFRAINVCLDANNLKPLDITDYFTTTELAELKQEFIDVTK